MAAIIQNERLEVFPAFHQFLSEHYREYADDGFLQKMKARAWERYLQLGLPNHTHDLYRYINLKTLLEQTFIPSKPSIISKEWIAAHVVPESKSSYLVFVNGHYIPELSCTNALSEKVVISSLNDASKTYNTLLNNHWAKSIQEEQDSFSILNAALHRDGAFIYIAPKTIVEAPIQLLHIVDFTQPMIMMPRVNVFVGAHAQVTFIATQNLLNSVSHFINQAVDVALEECAQVKYIQNSCHHSSSLWHFDALRAQLKKNSRLQTIMLTNGSSAVRHDYRMSLLGENAEVNLNGLGMLGNKREAHINVLVDHQAPHCRSMQHFKSVLDGFSKSSFEGKIFVKDIAQKTEAFQLNNNLLLSDRVQANSKPNLEIFADDVKASHGATMGQLDSEQLFYMKSRGFKESDAKHLLVYGFCKEMIDLIPLSSVTSAFSRQNLSHFLAGRFGDEAQT